MRLGGKVQFGGKVMEREGNYVEPTIVTGLPHDSPVVHRSDYKSQPLLQFYHKTRHGFRSDEIEPTIVTGLPHDSPVVHSSDYKSHCYSSTTRLAMGSGQTK